MKNSRGEIRFGCLLFVLLLGVAAYVGVIFVGSEFDYRSLAGEAQRQADLAAQETDEEILAALQRRVRELELPPQAARFDVRRMPGDRIRITGTYTDTLTFLDRWDWLRRRRIDIEQAY
jgi:hypothetical protein